jgi:hypothetical protein
MDFHISTFKSGLSPFSRKRVLQRILSDCLCHLPDADHAPEVRARIADFNPIPPGYLEPPPRPTSSACDRSRNDGRSSQTANSTKTDRTDWPCWLDDPGGDQGVEKPVKFFRDGPFATRADHNSLAEGIDQQVRGRRTTALAQSVTRTDCGVGGRSGFGQPTFARH